MSSVTIKNLTKSYGDVQVLKEFNEVFQDGEFVTLLGPSGCGKTTMLRLIAGFEIPTTGEILIDDKLVSSQKTFVAPENRNIGMVFQSYAVWPHMTVFDNVAYPLKIKRVPKAEISERVARILEVVHLAQYADRLPNQLSGGQQQRVALARALLAEPKLLLLDEPLSNLDAKLRESMRFEIKDITKALGITVVYVTHDQTEAMAMSDRIFLINNGVVQQSGSPQEIYNHPKNPFVADFLGKVDFFKGTEKDGAIHVTDWGADLPDPERKKDGDVEIAIRPENILIHKPGGQSEGILIQGKIEKMYYLGDVTDVRVKVGNALVRVISDGYFFRNFSIGEEVELEVRDYLVFEDEDVKEQTKIRT